jgi:hypothetical protein
MSDKYEDIDFDSVENIVELAEVFTKGPYDTQANTTEYESYNGIIEQYNNSTRNNYENAAMVLYVDRRRMLTEKIVDLKSMWFDEDGNRCERPVRKLDGE